MAIAYANSLDGVAASSFSYDAMATTNGLVIGMVRGGVGEADNKSATFGGVSMNKLGYLVLPTDRSLTVFWLVAPLSGSQTMAFSGGTINRSAASSYTGVKQTGQPEAGPTNTTQAVPTSSFSMSVTVGTANSWLIGSMSSVNQVNSAGTGTTVRINTNQTDLVDSGGALSTGSQSLVLTTPVADVWGGVIASFAPAVDAANSGFFLAASRR